MAEHEFCTVDVFASARFAGNQLAVFPDATAIPEDRLSVIARELRLSETVFVLPPEQGGTARVRIFTLEGEAAFAGHPLVGTALVLADRLGVERLALEVPAGIAVVDVTGSGPDRVAHVTTPAPLALADPLDSAVVAEALGIDAADIRVDVHAPTPAGMGREFVVTHVTGRGLERSTPDVARFARAREIVGSDRFSVLAYRDDAPGRVRARMFSPLTGTFEDAATGSANVALAGLRLSLTGDDELRLESVQGVEMGRPSHLALRAWRADGKIYASVAGTAVPVTRGWLTT